MASLHLYDVQDLLRDKNIAFGLAEYPRDFVPTRDMTLNGGHYYSYKRLRACDFSLGKPKFKAVIVGRVIARKATVCNNNLNPNPAFFINALVRESSPAEMG